MKNIPLIIESAKDGNVWGRVHFEDELLVEQASTFELLDKKMKKILKSFHDIDPKTIEFDLQ